MTGDISGVRELSSMKSDTAEGLYYPAVTKSALAGAKLINFAKFGNEQYCLNAQSHNCGWAKQHCVLWRKQEWQSHVVRPDAIGIK